jgi:invasion protein IalB
MRRRIAATLNAAGFLTCFRHGCLVRVTFFVQMFKNFVSTE